MENIRYYDIGLNLFCRQFPDPEKIIAEAEDNGVRCILTGTDTRENQKINDFVRNHNVFGTAGIHPHNADRARQEDFQLMEQILSENDRMVAVGECGLDYDRMFSARENQVRCLEKHIVLAEKLDMPLFLHERSAADDFVKRLKSIRKYVQSRWCTASRAVRQPWINICQWVFPSGLQAGFAMKDAERSCRTPCGSFRWIEFLWRRMPRI